MSERDVDLISCEPAAMWTANPTENRILCAGGFTLLEVMMALAVLAIALPVLLGLRNRDVDLHLRARDLTAATLLAQEKLLESELAGFLPLGETSGDFKAAPPAMQTPIRGERAPGYRWKRMVVPTPLESVREVRVQVIWPRGETEESVEVSTYVFQPAAS